MATTITHRRTRIVTLDAHEDPATHCKPGDIAIKEEAGGWGLWFIDEEGNVDGYGEPYPSHKEATWSAKAAAEYASAQ